MSAFVTSVPVTLPALRFSGVSKLCTARTVSVGNSIQKGAERVPTMIVTPEVDDKAEVTQYFNNVGFDRWNRIYSEEGEVNKVQLDIREGHAQTVDKVLKWIDEDGNANGKTFCDAGCGVGSLTLPLLARGAVISASDISEAMVKEAERRGKDVLSDRMQNVTFATKDLEALTGQYDTVCCIDVMIHYPTEKAAEMIRKLADRSDRRLIISFAPKTFLLGMLKKVGEFFPGPSKSTRAYLHSEEDVRRAIEECGMTIKRTEFTGTRFYFSKLLEAVKEA